MTSASRHLVAADFNRDGNLDLAEGDSAMPLLGRGDGTFEAPISYGVPGPLAAGDLNGDGKPDLAVRRTAGSTGNGDGTFQQPAESSASTSNLSLPGGEVIIADFNGDGRPDLAVAGERMAVLPFCGKGDGTFAQSFAVSLAAPPTCCAVAPPDIPSVWATSMGMASSTSSPAMASASSEAPCFWATATGRFASCPVRLFPTANFFLPASAYSPL